MPTLKEIREGVEKQQMPPTPLTKEAKRQLPSCHLAVLPSCLLATLPSSVIETLSDEEKDEYSERAAIMEYNGGLSRTEAEKQALERVIRHRTER